MDIPDDLIGRPGHGDLCDRWLAEKNEDVLMSCADIIYLYLNQGLSVVHGGSKIHVSVAFVLISLT